LKWRGLDGDRNLFDDDVENPASTQSMNLLHRISGAEAPAVTPTVSDCL